MKVVKRLLAVICLLAGGLLLGSIEASRAQEPEAPDASVETSRFDDWTVRCVTAEQKICQIFQQVTAKRGEQRFPLLTISLDGERLRLQLPHGFSLREAVHLEAAGLTFDVPYSVCTQQACFAGEEVVEKVIEAFQQGEVLKVTLARLQDEPLVVPVSLTGFSKAYAKMREAS